MVDPDTITPGFWRAARILGLEKVVSKIVETLKIKLNGEEKTFAEIVWVITGKTIARLWANRTTVGKKVTINLQAQGEEEEKQFALFKITSDPAGGSASFVGLEYFPSENGVRILDDLKQSHFVQLPLLAKRLLFTGRIKGTTGEILAGEGFTCTRTTTGKYTIKPKAGKLSSTITGIAILSNTELPNGRQIFIRESNAEEIIVWIQSKEGIKTDGDFDFFLMG